MKVDVLNSQTYSRTKNLHARLHAKYLDKEIGFKVSKTEAKLLRKYRAYDKQNDDSNKKQHYPGTQTWIGLNPNALQTTYNDIYDAFMILKEFNIEKVIDIGAGYGRVGLVMNSLIPKAQFIGYEIVKSRQLEGERIFEKYGLDNCQIINLNVLDEDFKLPQADIFFIYDFSELEDLGQILRKLAKRISHKNFFLITHGERIDYLMSNKYQEFWVKNGLLNLGELKIYSSNIDLNRRQK